MSEEPPTAGDILQSINTNFNLSKQYHERQESGHSNDLLLTAWSEYKDNRAVLIAEFGESKVDDLCARLVKTMNRLGVERA